MFYLTKELSLSLYSTFKNSNMIPSSASQNSSVSVDSTYQPSTPNNIKDNQTCNSSQIVLDLEPKKNVYLASAGGQNKDF